MAKVMSAKKVSNKKQSVTVKTSNKSVKKATRATPKKKTTSTKKVKGSGEQATSRKKATQKKRKQSESLTVEAVRIVEQAASILEEEISAGIVAAKKVGERYASTNSLRSGKTDEVMERFRNDAHEVLDIVLDLINLSINAVSGMSERAMNIRSTTIPIQKNNGKAEETLPELVVPEVLKPGESGKVGMLVENENENATGKFEFSTSGLLSPAGDLLNSTHISFNPASLEIDANDLEKVNITVFIPVGTPAGQYSGIVHASAIKMRALLTVHVEA
jgi:hypothetical protein